MIYEIKHSFKKSIFVPYLAISNNIDFFFDKNERICNTIDDVKCRVTSFEEINIFSTKANSVCRELYGIDIMPFIKRWYDTIGDFNSIHFIKLGLEKI